MYKARAGRPLVMGSIANSGGGQEERWTRGRIDGEVPVVAEKIRTQERWTGGQAGFTTRPNFFMMRSMGDLCGNQPLS